MIGEPLNLGRLKKKREEKRENDERERVGSDFEMEGGEMYRE